MCKICQKTFAQLTHLKKHILCIHETEKPYYCEICKGYYKVETDFEEKISKIHLGDNPIVEHALMVRALKKTKSLELLHNIKDDYNDPWFWQESVQVCTRRQWRADKVNSLCESAHVGSASCQ